MTSNAQTQHLSCYDQNDDLICETLNINLIDCNVSNVNQVDDQMGNLLHDTVSFEESNNGKIFE